MRSIRVLHIYRTYFPETQGGLQEAIRQFCFATQPFNVKNTVFALARKPSPIRMQLAEAELVRARSWFEIASCDFGGLSAVLRCREAAAAADILQIHYPWPFADILLPLIRRTGQPMVVTYVSDIVRQRSLDFFYAPVRRYLLRSADRIVASSPNYVASSAVLQDYAQKVECIPHCLAAGEGHDGARTADWERRLGRNFFLFVGVLRYYKGLDFLLEAARAISSPIVIVGAGPEGSRLQQEAHAKGIGNLVFLGPLSDEDKFSLYSLCRAVVFPSHLRSEAFGITLLEGARAAKPLISCEIGTGTTWVNRHLETGLVVPPENPQALASAMQQLADDDALCKRLGEGAEQRWRSHFSAEVVGRSYRDLYDRLLSPQR